MKHLIEILSLVLAGCGQGVYSVDPDFQVYVDSFSQASQMYSTSPVDTSNLVIHYGDLSTSVSAVEGSHVAGLCQEALAPTITIDPVQWKLLRDNEQEELVFHELGHCLLHRAHTSEVDQYGNPLSIMNPVLFSNYEYRRAMLLKELFNGTD